MANPKQQTTNINFQGVNSCINLREPLAVSDAATKQYADNLDWGNNSSQQVFALPNTGLATFSLVGMTQTVVGAASGNVINSATYRQNSSRVTIATTAGPAGSSEIRATQFLTNGARGFRFVYIFSINALGSTAARFTVGLFDTTAALTNVANNTRLNQLSLSAQANISSGELFLTHNDAAGVATEVGLGANYRISDLNNVYRFELVKTPAAPAIEWRVARLDNIAIPAQGGTISTDFPLDSVNLSPHIYMAKNGIDAATSFNFHKMFLEAF